MTGLGILDSMFRKGGNWAETSMKKAAGKGDSNFRGLDVGVYLMCSGNIAGVCVQKAREGDQ